MFLRTSESGRSLVHLVEGPETARAYGKAPSGAVLLQSPRSAAGRYPPVLRGVRLEPASAREAPEPDAAVAVGGVAGGVLAGELEPARPDRALRAGRASLGVVGQGGELVAGVRQGVSSECGGGKGGVEPGGERGAATRPGGEEEVAATGGAGGGHGREEISGEVKGAGGGGYVGLLGEGRNGANGDRGVGSGSGRAELDGRGVGHRQCVQQRDSKKKKRN